MQEVETYFVNLMSGYSQDLHKNAFMRLDVDNDGKIPKEEFEYYIDNFGMELSKEDRRLLLQQTPMDKDGNSYIY